MIRDGKLQRLFSLDEYASDNSDHTLPEIKAGTRSSLKSYATKLGIDALSGLCKMLRILSILWTSWLTGRYAFQKKYHFLDILAATDSPAVMADIQNIRITHRNGREYDDSIRFGAIF